MAKSACVCVPRYSARQFQIAIHYIWEQILELPFEILWYCGFYSPQKKHFYNPEYTVGLLLYFPNVIGKVPTALIFIHTNYLHIHINIGIFIVFQPNLSAFD